MTNRLLADGFVRLQRDRANARERGKPQVFRACTADIRVDEAVREIQRSVIEPALRMYKVAPKETTTK